MLTSDHLQTTRDVLGSADGELREPEPGRLLLQWPAAVGGVLMFQSTGTPLPVFGE
jgi:hypothetical protein